MCACVDVIIVRQPDQSLKCSPVVVRFDKPSPNFQQVAIFLDKSLVTNYSKHKLVLEKGMRYAYFQRDVSGKLDSPITTFPASPNEMFTSDVSFIYSFYLFLLGNSKTVKKREIVKIF